MQLIERALGVLRVVAEPPQGKTLTEISHQLNLPMPTAHRLLAALTDLRYIRRDEPSGQYRPGPGLMHLASLPIGGADVVSLAHAHLEELADEFGETVFVTQLLDGRALCVASKPSARALHVRVQPGRDLPLHASAGARSLLAYLDEPVVRATLEGHEFERFTGSTPRDVEAVMAHLVEVRAEGYDICEDELDANVWAVAAPVLDEDGRATASLTVAAPRDRVASASLRRAMIASVVRHADEISAGLRGPLAASDS